MGPAAVCPGSIRSPLIDEIRRTRCAGQRSGHRLLWLLDF